MGSNVKPMPMPHVQQPVVRSAGVQAQPRSATGNQVNFAIPRAVGNQAYRTLAAGEANALQADQPGAVAARSPTASIGPKLAPLAPETREQMQADIDRMVKILKSTLLDTADQINLLEILKKYARLDGSSNAARATPNLDHFLLLLKQRSFARSSVWSLGQDQWALVYDALWYRLRGSWLAEFKRLVAQSQTQAASGPDSADVENGLAKIAKQEAMGMWGMLKGLGTGLVGIAGPEAAQAIAKQFDESGRILFDHEWDSAEPLVAGMNAGQIGTVGGDVIWQLVMFAKSAGAKGGAIMRLATNLDKLRKAQQVLGVLGGIQGIAMGAQGIARVIETHQKAGRKITADLLLHDPDFIDQFVVLVSSAIGTAMAARATGSPSQQITRARIQMLLTGMQISGSLARLSEIAASDRSAAEKELEYGLVIASLIPQLVALAIDKRGHLDAKKAAASTTPLPDTRNESMSDAARMQPISDVGSAPAPHQDIPMVDQFSLPAAPPAKKTIGKPVTKPTTAPATEQQSAPVRKTIGRAPDTGAQAKAASAPQTAKTPVRKTIGRRSAVNEMSEPAQAKATTATLESESAKPDVGLADRGYRPAPGERTTTREQYKKQDGAKRWAKNVDAFLSANFEDQVKIPEVTGVQKPRIADKSVLSGSASERSPGNSLDIGTLPQQPGETPRQAVARVQTYIGVTLDTKPALAKHWNDARAAVLKKYTLTKDNYIDLYDRTRKSFWARVKGDPAARQALADAGFGFPGGRTSAPVLAGVASTVPVEDTRISLDHVEEKGQGANWQFALDADNLRMEFALPNTERENKQMRHPELR